MGCQPSKDQATGTLAATPITRHKDVADETASQTSAQDYSHSNVESNLPTPQDQSKQANLPTPQEQPKQPPKEDAMAQQPPTDSWTNDAAPKTKKKRKKPKHPASPQPSHTAAGDDNEEGKVKRKTKKKAKSSSSKDTSNATSSGQGDTTAEMPSSKVSKKAHQSKGTHKKKKKSKKGKHKEKHPDKPHPSSDSNIDHANEMEDGVATEPPAISAGKDDNAMVDGIAAKPVELSTHEMAQSLIDNLPLFAASPDEGVRHCGQMLESIMAAVDMSDTQPVEVMEMVVEQMDRDKRAKLQSLLFSVPEAQYLMGPMEPDMSSADQETTTQSNEPNARDTAILLMGILPHLSKLRSLDVPKDDEFMEGDMTFVLEFAESILDPIVDFASSNDDLDALDMVQQALLKFDTDHLTKLHAAAIRMSQDAQKEEDDLLELLGKVGVEPDTGAEDTRGTAQMLFDLYPSVQGGIEGEEGIWDVRVLNEFLSPILTESEERGIDPVDMIEQTLSHLGGSVCSSMHTMASLIGSALELKEKTNERERVGLHPQVFFYQQMKHLMKHRPESLTDLPLGMMEAFSNTLGIDPNQESSVVMLDWSDVKKEASDSPDIDAAKVEAWNGFHYNVLEATQVLADPDWLHRAGKMWFLEYNGRELEPALRSGAIALLDAKWLLNFARSGNAVLPCRQELPADAFLSLDEIIGCTTKMGSIQIFCISYMWLHPSHPDPKGVTLDLVARWLFFQLQESLGLFQQLPKENREEFDQAYACPKWAVFWDYASLYQHPDKDNGVCRTAREEELFHQGLGALATLYAHPHTHCFQVIESPITYPEGHDLPQDANCSEYLQRGWPFVEHCWAHLAKHKPEQTIDITSADSAFSLKTGTSDPPAPVTPNRMWDKLQHSSFTNGKSDRPLVFKLYKDYFVPYFASLQNMEYSRKQWGEDQIIAVADVINSGYCPLLESIDLSGNHLGAAGAKSLSETLLGPSAPPLLTKLTLDRLGTLTDADIETMAKALVKIPKLSLAFSGIGVAACRALGMAATAAANDDKEGCRLEDLDLTGNESIGNKGVMELLPILISPNLAQIDLSGTNLDGPGCECLVAALVNEGHVSPLRNIDLSDNPRCTYGAWLRKVLSGLLTTCPNLLELHLDKGLNCPETHELAQELSHTALGVLLPDIRFGDQGEKWDEGKELDMLMRSHQTERLRRKEPSSISNQSPSQTASPVKEFHVF